MIILLTPPSVLLGLVVTGILIIEFFLLVRLVIIHRQVRWLVSFDQAGQRLVDDTTGFVKKTWNRISTKSLSQKGQIIIGLVVLEIIRVAIGEIAG